jgi:hypothetical protein
MASAARSTYLANNAARWIETATTQLRAFPNLFAKPLSYDHDTDRIWAKLNIPRDREISYAVHGLNEINTDEKFAAALNTDIAFSAFESGLYKEALRLTKTNFRVYSWSIDWSNPYVTMDVNLKDGSPKSRITLALGGKNNKFFNAETGALGLRCIDDFFNAQLRGNGSSYTEDVLVPETFQLPHITFRSSKI